MAGLEKEVKLSAPVAGMSLTAEPKSRPWRKPYQLSNVDEVATHYMTALLNPEFTIGLTEQVETYPLALIADVLITHNTMEGLHSVDLGTLVSPIVIELMKALLDQEGVSYKVGDEQDLPEISDKKLIEIMDSLSTDEESSLEEMDLSIASLAEEEMPEQNTLKDGPVENRGLMSRKQ